MNWHKALLNTQHNYLLLLPPKGDTHSSSDELSPEGSGRGELDEPAMADQARPTAQAKRWRPGARIATRQDTDDAAGRRSTRRVRQSPTPSFSSCGPSLCLEMRIVPDAPEATGAAGAADSGARQESGESFFHQRADRRTREKDEVVPCPWRRTHPPVSTALEG